MKRLLVILNVIFRLLVYAFLVLTGIKLALEEAWLRLIFYFIISSWSLDIIWLKLFITLSHIKR